MPNCKKNAMEMRLVTTRDDRLIFSNLVESTFAEMADKKARQNFTRVNLNGERVWVLEIKGSIVGTLIADRLKDKDGIWLLSGLTIVPYWRKGGLATFMLKKCFEYIKENDGKVVLTFLHPELAAAEQLFVQKLHFIPNIKELADGQPRPQESYLASTKLS